MPQRKPKKILLQANHTPLSLTPIPNSCIYILLIGLFPISLQEKIIYLRSRITGFHCYLPFSSSRSFPSSLFCSSVYFLVLLLFPLLLFHNIHTSILHVHLIFVLRFFHLLSQCYFLFHTQTHFPSLSFPHVPSLPLSYCPDPPLWYTHSNPTLCAPPFSSPVYSPPILTKPLPFRLI